MSCWHDGIAETSTAWWSGRSNFYSSRWEEREKRKSEGNRIRYLKVDEEKKKKRYLLSIPTWHASFRSKWERNASGDKDITYPLSFSQHLHMIAVWWSHICWGASVLFSSESDIHIYLNVFDLFRSWTFIEGFCWQLHVHSWIRGNSSKRETKRATQKNVSMFRTLLVNGANRFRSRSMIEKDDDNFVEIKKGNRHGHAFTDERQDLSAKKMKF